jgi:hypothetical protein
VPKDINGASRTLRFDLDPSGPVLWPGPGEVVDALYFNKHRHWAPRVGGAYQMTDRLVFRGGYGVFNPHACSSAAAAASEALAGPTIARRKGFR